MNNQCCHFLRCWNNSEVCVTMGTALPENSEASTELPLQMAENLLRAQPGLSCSFRFLLIVG